jgi:single-stranded DNA-specific DHH superfamily exonuclease
MKMLSETQLGEIREHLEKAQNPLFFFDNDADGLCSFMILRKFIGRGRGVAIKSFPDLNYSYIRKVYELNPDYVFILDKPIVSKEFLEEMKNKGVPVVWIDHHEVNKDNSEKADFYYNPVKSDKKSAEPTTYWCYKATEKKQDSWIALLGCVGDGYLPDFIGEVQRKYPDLLSNCDSAFKCVYGTKIGEINKILSFGLKDRTTNVIKMLKFLVDVDNPYDILEENPRTYTFHNRYRQINTKYTSLMEKAKKSVEGDLVYFQYGGELSLSADIANELCYLYPEKIVVVAYIKGTKANISLRGSNVKEITRKAIENLENATGGGHEKATGAEVMVEDLPVFKKRISELVKSDNS